MSLLPTYIQTGNNAAVNIATQFGLYFQHGSLITYPEPKNIYTHEWADEGFDEVYIPDTPTFKSFTIDLDFVYIGDYGTYNQKHRAFLDYIGLEEFSIYDEWQKAGLRLRYLSYKESDKYRKDKDIWQFTMKFAVDKPLAHAEIFPADKSYGGQFKQECFLYFSDGTSKHVGKGERYTKTVKAGSFLIECPTTLGSVL